MQGGRHPAVRNLRAGEFLFRQAQEGTSIAVILDGNFEVRVNGTVVGQVGPGTVVGERASLEGGRRTADSVVENTTLGSGFQIAAHSSIESSSDGSWSAVSQYSIVSYSRRPNRWTSTPRISSVTKRKVSSSGGVQSKSPSGPTM